MERNKEGYAFGVDDFGWDLTPPPENLAYELGWVALGESLGDDDGCEAARAMGEAIVASTEMQAIKQAFLMLVVGMDEERRHQHLRNRYWLPQTVVDWVLS